jgi:recombination protein RecA
MKTKDKTKKIKNAIRRKREEKALTAADFLSTGSTMLNLACTGFPERGFAKGRYYFIVGDSISGKTFLSLTCLAEASINDNFKNYRFIYDNAEDGALMDVKRFFGERVFNRMEQLCSYSIEEFYFNVDDAIKDGRPFIYIIDSMDSLSSEPEGAKFDKTKDAYRRGKDAPGSYTDGKAKVNSAMLRRVIGKPLLKTGSILIIINQTRDKVNARPFESKKTRSGGHSLHFYNCLEIWSSVAGRIQKTVKGKKRQLGIYSKIKVKKNRFTGREREVIIPIYHSAGIDDVGSCVDYMLDEGNWTQKKEGRKTIINAKGLGIKGSRNKIIRLIEKQNLEKDLRELVSDTWNEIEEACTIQRKKKYE